MHAVAVHYARQWAPLEDRTVTTSRIRLLTLAVIALIGCDNGPSGVNVGSLSITIAGLPSGTASAVTVTGPNGYSQSVSSSQTLTPLESGTYTIAASNVTAGTTTYSPSPPTQTIPVHSSASATVTYSASSPTLGSLLVNVNGLPSGSNASITVTGPGGYNHSLTSTQTLTGLTPGLYTVGAQNVSPGGVTYNAAPNTQSSTVTAGTTSTTTVTYSPPSGGTLNLRIDGLYLTQSAQTYTGTIPLVQDRTGYLRVFVVANQVNVAAPTVRVRFYRDLVLQSEQIIPAPLAAVPTAADEGSLSNSWNIPVAASVIQPGLSIVAEVDPNNAVLESKESDNAFSSAPQALTVRSVPAVNVTLVPIRQKGNNLSGNVSVANASQFMDAAQRMHPLSSINLVVRTQYTTTTSDTLEDDNGNGAWGTILQELDILRIADGNSRHYYGVAKVSYSSGVAGVAYVSTSTSAERVAMGWDYLPTGSTVAAHELAHNWGRNHAPCGSPSGLDPSYPYASGNIGIYGLDVAGPTVKAPDLGDVMGYCDPKWISDYTYQSVMNYLSPASPVMIQPSVASANDRAVQPTLLVWGHIRDDRMVLEPAFQITTRPKLPQQPGPYSIEARAADGTTLMSLSFQGDEVADAPGNQRNFVFAVPLPSATVDRVSSLRLSGLGRQAMISRGALQDAGAQFDAASRADSVETQRVGGDVRLRWNARTTPMIMVRDASTGEILSLARGGEVHLPTSKGELELVLSDGVKSRVRRVSVR
jgi:Metallo-peptidase family M12